MNQFTIGDSKSISIYIKPYHTSTKRLKGLKSDLNASNSGPNPKPSQETINKDLWAGLKLLD